MITICGREIRCDECDCWFQAVPTAQETRAMTATEAQRQACGECRFWPPQKEGWPITKRDDWCGQPRLKNIEKGQEACLV